MKRTVSMLLSGASTLALAVIAPSAVMAQADAAPQSGSAVPLQAPETVETVTVTARKRAESDISVPTTINVISADKLVSQGVNDMYGLAQLTPQLIIGNNAASLGGSIVMRGVGSGALNGVEQTVAMNIDGMTVSHSGASRLGYFDLDHIEVLKGPQSLFFGKNSTGGVISFQSANPTPTLSGYVRAEYEVNADEYRAEGAVSGPLTDTLGFRVAVYDDKMAGYFNNPLPQDYAPGVYGPSYRRAPNNNEYGGRLTLAYNPSEKLDANFKLAFMDSRGAPAFAVSQLGYCPTGAPQVNPALFGVYPGECAVNTTVAPLGDASPAAVANLGLKNGNIYEMNTQLVSSLNVNYHPTNDLTVTSVTGMYQYILHGIDTEVGPKGDEILVPNSANTDISQELRLTSDFNGPLNFMLGALFQRSVYYSNGKLYAFGPFNYADYKLPGQTWSAFAQASYKLTDDLELSAGGRFTSESKSAHAFKALSGDVSANLAVDHLTDQNFSPEVTLTYRPAKDFTAFVSYKQGTKSGGFNPSVADSIPVGDNIAYGPEHVHGIEGGIKTGLLDDDMRLDVSIYRYIYKDLQVSAYDPVLIKVFVQNAASAKVQGVELSAHYRPHQLAGLNFDGSLAYNDARFDDFIGACYNGQTIAAGCDLLSNGAHFTSQDLTGRQLPSAPAWTGSGSATYGFDIDSDYRLEIGTGARFVGPYNPAGDFAPGGYQKSAVYLDANVRLLAADGSWELALIGRNLTDQLRAQTSFGQVGTGSTAGLPTGTPADQLYFVNRPTEVRLQLTLRPAFLNP